MVGIYTNQDAQNAPEGEPENPEDSRTKSPTLGPVPTNRAPLSRANGGCPNDYGQPQIIRELRSASISIEELIVEVKSQYRDVVNHENRCKKIQKNLVEKRCSKVTDQQWRAIHKKYTALIGVYHDFFSATQHTAAFPAMRKLPTRYSMPGRMFQHGIFDLLEELRHRLPASLDHLLNFFHFAFGAVTDLYRTKSAFKSCWTKCLGDLALYRMDILEQDSDREEWDRTARLWYSKSIDEDPEVGSNYHCLAQLAMPGSLEKLSLCLRSLVCTKQFIGAHDSIETFFQSSPSARKSAPCSKGSEIARSNMSMASFLRHKERFVAALVTIHAGLFAHGNLTDENIELLSSIRDGLLINYVDRSTTRFREQGVFIALANIAAFFAYGVPKSIFRLSFLRVWVQKLQEQKIKDGTADDVFEFEEDEQTLLLRSFEQEIADHPTKDDQASSKELINFVSELHFTVFKIALQRPGNASVFPLVHVALCFLWSLTSINELIGYVHQDIPWADICSFLNVVAKRPYVETPKIWTTRTLPMPDRGTTQPMPHRGMTQPLPEDYAIRGQLYSLSYYPEGWFEDYHVDLEERSLEPPSTTLSRAQRILWLGMEIASVSAAYEFPHVISLRSSSNLNLIILIYLISSRNLSGSYAKS
ncbi:MAG: hypothetical protein Q9210_001795 [Variospora velana]